MLANANLQQDVVVWIEEGQQAAVTTLGTAQLQQQAELIQEPAAHTNKHTHTPLTLTFLFSYITLLDRCEGRAERLIAFAI